MTIRNKIIICLHAGGLPSASIVEKTGVIAQSISGCLSQMIKAGEVKKTRLTRPGCRHQFLYEIDSLKSPLNKNPTHIHYYSLGSARHGVKEIAFEIAHRIRSREGHEKLTVGVSSKGTVYAPPTDHEQANAELEARGWIVGTYDKRATVAHIAEDIADRVLAARGAG